jgi:hypothetical protein
MKPNTAGLAGFLAAAILALLVSQCAHSCGHVPPRVVATALFFKCLHAPRPERRQCEADYIAFSATIGSVRK